MTSQIEVLVVDDSAFMRKVVSELLDEYSDIKVVDQARNGEDALKKLEQYTPDVITLDVEMPRMDGLEFLQHLMAEQPLPVVMLSSVTEKGSKATIEALELGAFDFIPKPSGAISLDIKKVKTSLVEKVRLAAQSNVKRKIKQQDPTKKENLKQQKQTERRKIKSVNQEQDILLVIGASTGGPKALKEVFSRLPGDLNAAVLVVQHMPAGFTTSLAERLDKLSELNVKEAERGNKLEPGKVFLAPGNYHLVIDKAGIDLTQEDKLHNVRPAIDKTMESVVENYEGQIVGVLLTGMGKDGTHGLELIKEVGGQTIAQDETTSVVYGMPRSAYERGAVDVVKPVQEIAAEIVTMINN